MITYVKVNKQWWRLLKTRRDAAGETLLDLGWAGDTYVARVCEVEDIEVPGCAATEKGVVT